jgi:hypothetical protein
VPNSLWKIEITACRDSQQGGWDESGEAEVSGEMDKMGYGAAFDCGRPTQGFRRLEVSCGTTKWRRTS